MTTTSELPDFDRLWDYDRPEVSEQAFREILPLVSREAMSRVDSSS